MRGLVRMVAKKIKERKQIRPEAEMHMDTKLWFDFLRVTSSVLTMANCSY